MTDHELMTLAAKAVGYEVHGDKHPPDGLNVRMNGKLRTWYPLVSDGDAFRLMVELGLNVFQAAGKAWAVYEFDETSQEGDPADATRRAIVRAASQIAADIDAEDRNGMA